MKLVILESPYAGNIERNLLYARCCIRHSLSLGESPIASHLLYTQPGILDDSIPEERDWGMKAGAAWRKCADYTVHYLDFGSSSGMTWARGQLGLHVNRRLPKEFWSKELLALTEKPSEE